MLIIPAIDIRGGRCVSLFQGDYGRETVFSDAPSVAARRWSEAGARWVHVVDLDGAKAGQPVNLDAIASICDSVIIPVELGGGIRSLSSGEE